ncbi:hypothetical protein [Nitrosopumilus sp. Nsub]|uniref:hypothetical protein n=1 Tax=Nitrosopumilus sp. Nsub TaxID=1776294 RepID=UPI000AEBECD1|nr:hypothetical protein [Nitrosopumilus sp. Nsub]
MTTKNIKTILFAGLIAAMILPFSVMDFAEAESNEHKENIEKIKEQKKAFQEQLAKEKDTAKKDKLRKYIERADMFEEVETLLDQKQTEKTQKQLAKIYNKLSKHYSSDENGVKTDKPVNVDAFENSPIPPAYATSTGNYTTSLQYRADCDWSGYGWSQGSYTAYSSWTNISNTWNYPTIIKDSSCNTWDFEDNWMTVFGYQIYCPYTTVFLTANYWCAAGEGDYVTIWSNADYDGPLNPPAQQSFTQFPAVTTKTL